MILWDPIFDQVIKQLIIHQWLSIQHLYKKIVIQHEISLPNFYKIISNFIDDQILIKENGKLFFHNRWILWFLEIADELKKHYLSTDSHIMNLQEWQIIYHEWSTIQSIDGIWWGWMLDISKLYNNKEKIYVYQAHPYYMLGMYETEYAFFEQTKKTADVCFITWNNWMLDKYGVEFYKKIDIQSVCAPAIPFLKDWYCVTIIGDYVFEVLYPQEITDYFSMFFSSISSLDQFKQDLFSRIFNMKSNFKLTLRRDSKHALQLKKIFERSLLGYYE